MRTHAIQRRIDRSAWPLATLALAVMLAQPVLGQVPGGPSARPDRDLGNLLLQQRIRGAMQQELDKIPSASGMLLGIVKNGRIYHLGAYGLISIQDRTPVTEETVWPWASVSKLLTAVAAWQQMDDRYAENRLTLGTTANSVLPYWPPGDARDQRRKSTITVGQLLSHRSGLRHWDSGLRGGDMKDRYDGVRTLLPTDWNAPASVGYYRAFDLLSSPGQAHEYSTFGSTLLGAVVDNTARTVSNGSQDYVSWIQENVADALGMTSLSISEGFRYSLPGAGWESNIEDMTRFMIGLMDGSLTVTIEKAATPLSVDRMWTDIPMNRNYGYGPQTFGDDTRTYFGHGGVHSGVRSTLAILADGDQVDAERFGVAVMVNAGRIGVDANGNRIFVNLRPILAKAYEVTH